MAKGHVIDLSPSTKLKEDLLLLHSVQAVDGPSLCTRPVYARDIGQHIPTRLRMVKLTEATRISMYADYAHVQW